MQTSEPISGLKLSQLPDRIIHVLHASPLQKAGEIAHWIGIDTSYVLKVLTELQGITVQQDSAYRWSLMSSEESAEAARRGAVQPRTEISRLSQYFLDCLGQDSDTGISTFAKPQGPGGTTEYAELTLHPNIGQHRWWESPEVRRVLSAVRFDTRNLEAWVGYPVHVRKHKTANWEGFFVEPVLLWRVISSPDGAYRLEEGLPQINFSFLRSIALGGASEVVEEAAALGTELGLNNLPKDQPSTEELLLRMFNLRPEWDWSETLDPSQCSTGEPLSEISEPGIYNRAVVVPSKRSPYTQGLESELKTLSETPAIDFLGTALDQWFNGHFLQPYVDDSDTAPPPLIEVLPMNSEQRASVQSALVAPLTVVTGPPGTGKSQVVTNLLVNAAWRGMRVLFASKNNKAVDVVESRVNNLGNRPVLLRLGSSEYQGKLSNYFASMLTGQVGPEDLQSYQERLSRHTSLLEQAELLDDLTLKTMETRNYVDQLDSEVDGYRKLFKQGTFLKVSEDLLDVARDRLYRFVESVHRVNPAHATVFDKLFGFLFKESRLAALLEALEDLMPISIELGVDELDVQRVGFDDLEIFAHNISERLEAGQSIISYKAALETLLMSPPLETIAQHRLDVTEQVAKNSAGLWKDWVQLVPSRLSKTERQDVAEYASLLQALSDPSTKNTNPTARRRAFELQQKVTALFTCWAVTSLSVRGKVPLEPGYFDLVVIDEAGQCDIASAIPLLFRAKRAVIIGDPMQLKHISALSRSKDLEFQAKHGLSQSRAAWLYSINSLYDLAAGVSTPGSIINLRDHHRSHADIIGYSNRAFYADRLRIATKHSSLVAPAGQKHGIAWTEVPGECMRPVEGGLRNPAEAERVLEVIKDLLLTQKFKGTVGVVTPFRSQATLIQSLLNRHGELASAANRSELIVDTAHRFQGDERDVIIFSPVVSDNTPKTALSFLQNNANLFNVAVTRARALLHVVGNSGAMQACGVAYFADFAKYVQAIFATEPIHHTPQEDLGPTYPAVAKPDQVSEWERSLYSALYSAGIRAIPQYTVEQFDLDFAVIIGNRKLAIEVDGDQYHRSWTNELCLRDQLRNQRLIELGWEVKRFWVYELRDQLPECVEQIFAWTKIPR
jgi:very-short-patch-repair endonuclease/predicted ATPase